MAFCIVLVGFHMAHWDLPPSPEFNVIINLKPLVLIYCDFEHIVKCWESASC